MMQWENVQDGSGDISMEELKEMLSFDESLDDRYLTKLIAQVDLDGDGTVSLCLFEATHGALATILHLSLIFTFCLGFIRGVCGHGDGANPRCVDDKTGKRSRRCRL